MVSFLFSVDFFGEFGELGRRIFSRDVAEDDLRLEMGSFRRKSSEC